jgi:hypothetical protein
MIETDIDKTGYFKFRIYDFRLPADANINRKSTIIKQQNNLGIIPGLFWILMRSL